MLSRSRAGRGSGVANASALVGAADVQAEHAHVLARRCGTRASRSKRCRRGAAPGWRACASKPTGAAARATYRYACSDRSEFRVRGAPVVLFPLTKRATEPATNPAAPQCNRQGIFSPLANLEPPHKARQRTTPIPRPPVGPPHRAPPSHTHAAVPYLCVLSLPAAAVILARSIWKPCRHLPADLTR